MKIRSFTYLDSSLEKNFELGEFSATKHVKNNFQKKNGFNYYSVFHRRFDKKIKKKIQSSVPNIIPTVI
jgi:hypothetical protein